MGLSKICINCDTLLPLSCFTFRTDTQKYRNQCKKCIYQQNKLSIQKYKKNNRDKEILSTENWRKKNPKKRNAQSMLQYYVKIGNIIKPTICENCKIEGNLQGHHFDYNKPLSVIWLCPECHKNTHMKGD